MHFYWVIQRWGSADDNIRRPAAPFFFQDLLQGQILDRVQVVHGKVGVVGSVIGKGLVNGIQDVGPFITKITSEGILQPIR